MSERRPVVWSEGLLLTPQHFQQTERAFRHLVAQRFRYAHSFEWGLTRLSVDAEAVRNGRVVLTAAAGVLPDGTPFALPDDDPLPPQRTIEGHFDAKLDAITVSLGLPGYSESRAQLGDGVTPGAAGPRFAADTAELPDDNTAQSARPVEVQRRHFQVLFPDDAVGEHDALPIAELVRTPEGAYALREAYVPPCLSIGASEALLRQLRTLHEMLIAKSTALGDQRRQRGGIADFSAQDTANAMLLYTVDARIPALSHALLHRGAHPEDVYLELMELSGQLCAFSDKLHPRDLPAYDHRALTATFARLEAALRELMEIQPVDKATRVLLEHKGAGMWVGRLTDDRLVGPGTGLYLGVRADLEEQRLAAELPAKLKIASLDKIDFLIANALRGVPLLYQRVPPPSLPVKGSYLYFQLDPKGDAWETVRSAKNLAIYVPPDVPNATLEMLGLRE
ncbi:MAG TPA: type VI secretion system baseplate subunit TssK [Candidatus Eisenbacteria bacterium]|nr:type VI secretion system baseplate subunit TssK [Candidatus Eisenbacteria bacterium]